MLQHLPEDWPDPMADPAPMLREGDTCWRIAQADRMAFLVDGADYFAAVKAALIGAKRSIWLLAWVFDPLTRLTPDRVARSGDPQTADRLGLLLRRLAALNPALDVRVLAWDMPPAISAPQAFAPQRGQAYFVGSRVKYRLDGSLPSSACQHQKVLVIDNKLAFVAGGDLGWDRWDTCDHADHDPRRRLPNGKRYPARHDVSIMLEGPVAQSCSDLFEERWRRATGEIITAPPPPTAGDDYTPWPEGVVADLNNHAVAIARTEPTWRKFVGVQESLKLYLEAIERAKSLIYLENQYLTSPVIVAALAKRLAEPDGPEVVAIGPVASPSFFDRMAMDSARTLALNRLIEADVHGRFRAYCARTVEDQPVVVHSKLAIFDDTLLRIGSANLNNRSTGLDTECETAIEAAPGEAGERARQTIGDFLYMLVGHFIGRSMEEVELAMLEHGSLGAAIDALDSETRRLRRIRYDTPKFVPRMVATWAIGDPTSPSDAWRPWLRRKRLRQEARRLGAPPPAQ